MANTPTSSVVFNSDGSGDRKVDGLPQPLPSLADDVDWQTRDYDGFRLLMLEELAARVPERRRFTPADLEVVLIEALASVLDQVSDMADRVAAEAYLETARRPESVRRLLSIIGYDAVARAQAEHLLAAGPIAQPQDEPTPEKEKKAQEQKEQERKAREQTLDRLWLQRPWLMEQARITGPRLLRRQVRMVTVDDHRQMLELHPLVRQAGAASVWGGAWPVMRISVLLRNHKKLNEFINDTERDAVADFCNREGLTLQPDLEPSLEPEHKKNLPPAWKVLAHYIDQLRMVGQDYEFWDVKQVGISIAFTVRISSGYFQSEVRQALLELLDTQAGGFFEEGRHRCGEDIRLGDLLQLLTGTGGVESVLVDEFRRDGDAERLTGARIAIGPDEYAALRAVTLVMQGGRLG